MLKRTISLFLCLALLMCICGCQTNSAVETTAPPTEVTEPTPSAGDLYASARLPLDQAENIKLLLTTELRTTVGPETIRTFVKQDMSLVDIGESQFTAKVLEEIDVGDQFIRNTEYYTEGTLYVSSAAGEFKGNLAPEAFLDRFCPPVLLDASLYGRITAESVEEGTMLSFSSPSAPESWALPSEADFISGSGNALLNPDGTLAWTRYEVIYDCGASHVEMTVTAEAQARPTITIIGLSSPSVKYTETNSIAAIKPFTLALSQLKAAQSVQCICSETVVCEAANVAYSNIREINYCGIDEDFLGSIEYALSIISNNEIHELTFSDRAEGGEFVYTDADGIVETATYTPDITREYFQSSLSDYLYYLSNADAVEMYELGGLIYIELLCNKQVGTELNNYTSDQLFGDAGYLNANASKYETKECGAYLAIDPSTGFPTAAGTYFTGVHTINGSEFILNLNMDYSYFAASPFTREDITGQAAEEPEPEVKATPLLYHVTGEDGQEMWLMGTIHIGDERTAYLPQQVYDALGASDALALEFDIDAFQERLEADAILAQTVASGYIYSDGSMTYDHLSPDVYHAGRVMLRASGCYNYSMEFIKPFFWGQAIRSIYMQQSYSLQSGKGVDMRLMKLAEEMGLEILEVESGELQMRMLSDFSDELQQVLLIQSFSTTIPQYRKEMLELYELWCAGDEEALRAELNSEVDTSKFTEEELAEYEAQLPLIEEYNKAMSYDRNDGMLKVAIEYLESGDVVFYAVGLAHLLDNTNGLVDSLREAGYTVELVQYS